MKVVFALIVPSLYRRRKEGAQTLSRVWNTVRMSRASPLDRHSHLIFDDYFPEGNFNNPGDDIVARKMIESLRDSPSLLPAAGID